MKLARSLKTIIARTIVARLDSPATRRSTHRYEPLFQILAAFFYIFVRRELHARRSLHRSSVPRRYKCLNIIQASGKTGCALNGERRTQPDRFNRDFSLIRVSRFNELIPVY